MGYDGKPLHLLPGRKAEDKIIDTGVLDDEGKPIAIRGSEIGLYISPEFIRAWNFYETCVRMQELGPPYEGGWMTWPEEAVIAIQAFSGEEIRWRMEHPNGE